MRERAMLLAFALLALGRELPGQKLKERATLHRHSAAVDCVALSPDGKRVATAGRKDRGGEVVLWDISSGKVADPVVLQRETSQVLAFSPDGRLLASEIYGVVSVWDVAARKQRTTFRARAITLVFSSAGKRLVAADERRAELWDVTSGKQLSSFRRLVPASSRQATAISEDLRTLTSGNYQEIDLWDVETGKQKTTLSEHRGQIISVSFSRDGKTVVAASTLFRARAKQVGDIRLWDIATGRERAVFQEGIGYVRSARLSPDGKTVAALDREDLFDTFDFVKLLDVATGKQRLVRSPPEHRFTALDFTTDGRLFVIGTADHKAVKIWEVPTNGRR